MQNTQRDVRRLMVAMNKIDGLYYRAARRYGVKGSTLTLLYALDDGEPHSQKQICDEWLIPRTTINTIVKECVKDGTITLLCEKHSKEKTIVITPTGHACARRMLQGVYDTECSALAQTESRFSDEFVTALEQFTRNLHAEFEKTIFRAGQNE